MNSESILFFQNQLLNWFQVHGRHDLPWQHQSPYHIWISEIMLQQTQVLTVIPYYHRFISRFPDITSLAHADNDEVCHLWAGLGYYHRAKNILKTAQILYHDYQSQIPDQLEILKTLPGIGPSTAAAITSQAFSKPHAIFDGNVKRVLARFFGIEGPVNDKSNLKILEQLAHACMPNHSCQSYTQAIMDMGATCCKPKSPLCPTCPLQDRCQALLQQKTDIIPAKARKKPLKTVNYTFLVYQNAQQEIFLIKRPKLGIWPNLWCLPETTDEIITSPLVHIQHQLTHQVMDIRIYVGTEPFPLTNLGLWVNEGTQNLGLPKPISVALPKIFLALKSPSPALHQVDHPPQHD